MELKTQLSHGKVRHDQENDIHMVVSLKAPKLDWQNKRAPVCIIPVIDVSSSMCGDKLHYAKQSAIKLVEHLKPGDWCGLVAFGSEVFPISPPREMTQHQKDDLKGKIGALRDDGCTNFSGGMVQALEWAKTLALPENVQIRVIMFTDGHANRGIATDLQGLTRVLQANKGRASLSAFGYGQGADEDLLASLARVGGGNYAFVKSPEEALTAFARELGGLLSTYATGIEVTLEPNNGNRITEVLSDVDVEQEGKTVKITVPSIFSEEEIHLVAAVKLSEHPKALPRPFNVAEVKVGYRILQDDGTLSQETLTEKVKVKFVNPGKEDTAPDPEVDKIVGMAQLVQAQIKAEEQARVGDYAGSMQVMSVLGESLQERGLGGLARLSRKVSSKMKDSQSYASSKGYLNSSKQMGTRALSLSNSDGEAMADWNGVGVQSSNSSQEGTVRSFTEGGAAAPPQDSIHIPYGQVDNGLGLGSKPDWNPPSSWNVIMSGKLPPGATKTVITTTESKKVVTSIKENPASEIILTKSKSSRW